MIPTLALGFLLAARPVVASDSDCPSARDIESHLSVLLSANTAQNGTASVTAAPDGLVIDLRPETPQASAQRSLAVVGTCEERARAAAVVIATWWPTKPAPSPQPALVPATAASTVAGGQRPRPLVLAAGGFASVVAGSLAAGARIEALLFHWSPAVGPRLALSGTSSHGGKLGAGQAHFSRATAELGVAFTTRIVTLDAGALASLFWVEGSDFNVNQKATGFAAGATAGARVSWPLRRLQPWLGLRGLLWPQSQRIYVLDSSTDTETSRAMPYWELQLGAGIAFTLL